MKAGETTDTFFFSNGLGSSKMYSCPSLSNIKAMGDVTEEKQRLKGNTKDSPQPPPNWKSYLGNAF